MVNCKGKNMPVQPGDVVSAHYVGTLDSGEEFDRSPPGSPLTVRVGRGLTIPGLETALLGREKGDSFTVVIPADMAYGFHDRQLIFQIPRGQVPANLSPEPGALLHVATDQGELEVKVTGVDAGFVTLDANHPLAGQNLTLALHIVDVC
jgi:peptidylprolyl isomerase